jgi:hypothetical protein
LPVIGCGTYVGFDVATNSDKLRALADVVRTLREAGGKLFDSSPMYGRAEAVLGELLASAPAPERTFIATKIWTRGRQAGITQMEHSFALLKAKRIDLMQVPNLVDWQTHVATLRGWKQDGRIRYLGITHYTASAHDELEAVMRKETLDFVQLNYSLDDRGGAQTAAACGRPRHSDFGQLTIRWRRSFAAPAEPAPVGLGGRDGLQQLGTNPAEIRSLPAGRYLRDSRHGKSRAYGGQLPSRKRNTAGCRLEKAHRC